MSYLSQSGVTVWNFKPTPEHQQHTSAITAAIDVQRPFTMLPDSFCNRPIKYFWFQFDRP
jgi:hypothetical protein